MKNKILSILILLILVTTTMSTISNSTSVSKSSQKNIQELSSKQIDNSKYPVMIEPPDINSIEDETPRPTIIDTPDEFSWLNYDGINWVTPIKSQGNCGSCWAFALLGAMESVVKIRENQPKFQPDLSEQYVLSCLPSSGSCRGGSSLLAAENIFNTDAKGNYCNGVIPESCMLYEANDDIPCSDKCSNWEEKLIPISDYGYHRTYGRSDDRELIKTLVFENGPIASHIKATDLFKNWGAINHNPNSYYPDFEITVGVNHVIVVLGWKDSSSIKNGGYWICKNSWDTGWGYDGFFNVEYGAIGIDKSMVVWVDYNPEDYDFQPVVETGGPYSSNVGEEITFDASDSFGIEGDIICYEWDFGDQTYGNGKTITHTYLERDEYIVNLTVTDDKGLVSIKKTFARVQDSNNNPPNKPNIDGKITGKTGERYTYEIFSVDPDGDDVYYKVKWGDGTIDEYGPETYFSGKKVSFTKKWNEEGTYTIEVTAMDRYGAESVTAKLSVSMPKIKPIIVKSPLLKLLENYPILYQIIQRFLRI